MKALSAILLLVGLSQVAVATECQFDQELRIENNIQLQKKYPGSVLVEKNLVLVVPIEEGQIKINIGGCEHYGVSVELRTKNPAKYQNEAQLMSLILRLARTYPQGDVDTEILKKVIENKNWIVAAPSRAYFLKYEDFSTFEVYTKRDGEFTILGFNYYS
jgi:hypothetical protein